MPTNGSTISDKVIFISSHTLNIYEITNLKVWRPGSPIPAPPNLVLGLASASSVGLASTTSLCFSPVKVKNIHNAKAQVSILEATPLITVT